MTISIYGRNNQGLWSRLLGPTPAMALVGRSRNKDGDQLLKLITDKGELNFYTHTFGRDFPDRLHIRLGDFDRIK